jgi:hypothetical protein
MQIVARREHGNVVKGIDEKRRQSVWILLWRTVQVVM